MQALLLAASVCGGGCLAAVGLALGWDRHVPVWDNSVRRSKRHQRELRAVAAVGGGLVVLGALLGLWLPAAVGAAVCVGAHVQSKRLARSRIQRLEQQLPGWLLAVTQGLRVNPSLEGALRASLKLVSDPLREEIEQVVAERHVGCALEEALDRWAQRSQSSLVHGVVTALKVARQTGGDAAPTIERVSAALKEGIRVEGVLRTKTAEGRIQAIAISILPAPMAGLVHWLQPGYFEPLWHHLMGYVCMAVFAVLWVGAVVAANKILAVEL
jgi:tight adherence protein B